VTNSYYLSHQEILNLLDVVAELSGNYLTDRGAILSALPSHFRGGMTDADKPRVQLLSDLNKLNRTERLADGSVPFETWLRQVLALYGSDTKADTLRSALTRITQKATGAPDVEPPTEAEIKEVAVHQDDTLPVTFMHQGLMAASSVAKLVVKRYENGVAKRQNGNPVLYLGTGWLIAPDLLITNHHVLNARMKDEPAASQADFTLQAMHATVLFDFDHQGAGGQPVEVISLVAADPGLDYALVAIKGGGRAPLTYVRELPVPPPGHGAAAVNIIQHPGGKPKSVAIRNNLVAGSSRDSLRYFTDTDNGSSGSPVLNDQWQAVALHRGSTYASGVTFQGKSTAYLNVGTRISAVLDHLHEHYSGPTSPFGL